VHKVAFTWDRVCQPVRRRLVQGVYGPRHLSVLADECLQTASRNKQNPEVHLPLGKDLLIFAWIGEPLNAFLAEKILMVDRLLPGLSLKFKHVLTARSKAWPKQARSPEDKVPNTADAEELADFYAAKIKNEPGNPYWLYKLHDHCRTRGEFEPLRDAFARIIPEDGMRPPVSLALGQAAYGLGDFDLAVKCFSTALPHLSGYGRDRLAYALLAAGETRSGMMTLAEETQTRPWNVNAVLCLYDLVEEQGARIEPPPGKTAVMAYTYNKAEVMDQTLAGLAASDLGDTDVFVLNNGSTDRTESVLAKWAERLGPRMRVISLPVNIGAPAARNWLTSLPEIAQYEFLAFIDDDIELPGDWLARLGGAVETYPEAGVWGCKVVDHERPAVVQCADVHIDPGQNPGEQLTLSDIHQQETDFGQWSYARPCASVTGCVHLFTRDRLMDIGHFDIRYSPTQYDDFDRDLRMLLNGRTAVYQGHLAIPHKRKSGRKSEAGGSEEAGAAANLFKLQNKYSPQEFEVMIAAADKAMLGDVKRKLARLAESLRGELRGQGQNSAVGQCII